MQVKEQILYIKYPIFNLAFQKVHCIYRRLNEDNKLESIYLLGGKRMRKKKGLMATMLGIMGAGAALANRSPDIKKIMPNMNKMMSNIGVKKTKNRNMTSMIATGLLGFGLAKMLPMGRNFIRQRQIYQGYIVDIYPCIKYSILKECKKFL